jgi:hypothetical protein
LAQSFEAGIHVTTAQWSEFDGADTGVGGRVTFKPSSMIGVDADAAWYPSDFPGDTFAFSGSRIEALFGVTVGPQIDRVRPFVKAAGGVLRTSEAPEPFACIAIFPPPLNCLMAAGHTMPAFELGGGVQFGFASRAFARADVSGRWLKYPGPSFRSFPTVQADEFWGSGLRVSFGAGMKF